MYGLIVGTKGWCASSSASCRLMLCKDEDMRRVPRIVKRYTRSSFSCFSFADAGGAAAARCLSVMECRT